MPLCGFTPKMLEGLDLFADELIAQAHKRTREEKISLGDAFESEVHEMNIFLAALDEKYFPDAVTIT